MGMLTQALAGATGAVANAGSAMILKKMEMDAQAARELRAENLARLREQRGYEHQEKMQDTTYNRADSGMVSHYGEKLSNEEAAQFSKDNPDNPAITHDEFKRLQEPSKTHMIQDEKGNVREATNEEIKDLTQAEKARAIVDENRFGRTQSLLSSAQMKNATPEERGRLMSEKDAPTKDEEEALDTWKDDKGKSVRIAELDAKRKHVEKLEEKAEQARLDLIKQQEGIRQRAEEARTTEKQHGETLKALKGMGGSGKTDNEKTKDLNTDAQNKLAAWKIMVKDGTATQADYEEVAKAQEAAGRTAPIIPEALKAKLETTAKRLEAKKKADMEKEVQSEYEKETGLLKRISNVVSGNKEAAKDKIREKKGLITSGSTPTATVENPFASSKAVPAGYNATGKTSGGLPVYYNPNAPKGKQYYIPE